MTENLSYLDCEWKDYTCIYKVIEKQLTLCFLHISISCKNCRHEINYKNFKIGSYFPINLYFLCKFDFNRYYLPTPPLGQDMTQGQFLSGV